MTSALWSCAVFSSIMVSLGQITDKQNDWSNCRPICKCKWVSGKKTAECMNADLSAIPDDLSPELQTVDLSGNNIRVIGSEAFKNVGLINLHKIYLKECGIEILDKDAFKGLQILIELYLSDNKIHTLHTGTFKDNVRLRVLVFNKNPIQKLDDDLFKDLQYLQTVEMSGCNLSQISVKSFSNVPNLQHLALDGNNLSFIKLAAVERLIKLRSLVLHHNPWRCDCHLRSFRAWIMERNLYSQPTACSEPYSLQNRLWNEIESEEYACKPNIIYPNPGTSIAVDSDEITLSCQVTGNPVPEVYWVFNSKIIPNNWRTSYSDQRYTVKTEGTENKWVNLTINKVQSQDRGEFTCVAKNYGGVDERNITLLIKSEGVSPFDTGITTNDSWPLTIGLITGCSALLILVIIFCFCCCRKRSRRNKKKASGKIISSNTDISSTKNSTTEQEKRLLTIVNPVDKVPPNNSPTEGTELLVLKKILNDDNNTLISSGGCEVEKSVESLPQIPRMRSDKTDAYPPDLIAFPGRGSTASPATMSTSNIIDTSRIRPHVGSQSPMNNSMIHFGTLPYSRSESPFSPVAPVVLSRQGYVTIPRRPRVPSWSSAPTPTLLDERLSPLKAEPVYDNLGPRTTADGSSVLSLNKDLGSDTLQRKIGTMSPHNFHLDKRDTAGHLISPHIPVNDTQEPVSCLKRVASAEGNFNSGDTYTPMTPKTKVTPKPPPKPNKNLTLYEDETEDGTEV